MRLAALASLSAFAACGDPAPEADSDEPPALDLWVAAPPWSGEALTADNLSGAWAARAGDCADPDFTITRAGRGLRVDTHLNGWVRAGSVRLGVQPAMVFTNPRRTIRMEPREDGLYLLPPPDGMVVVGNENVFPEGVAFGKCAA